MNDTTEPNLPAKRVKLTPEGVNQADIDAVLKRLAEMRKRFKSDILFVGGKLAKMRSQLPHGRWEQFLKLTFPLSVKTANIWIRAYENRDSELAVSDWDAYMRVLYGNVPKKLKAPSYQEEPAERDEDDELERDILEQSGGEGLSGLFPDKDKADFYSLKKVIASLRQNVLAHLTLKAKRDFLTELGNWVENEKKNLGAS